VVNDAPMYSISYYKPQRMVRLTWLLGTTAMTDQDFKGALEAFAEAFCNTALRGSLLTCASLGTDHRLRFWLGVMTLSLASTTKREL
jgi:hypothetical protein